VAGIAHLPALSPWTSIRQLVLSVREGELVIKERLHSSLIPLAFSSAGKLARRGKALPHPFLGE